MLKSKGPSSNANPSMRNSATYRGRGRGAGYSNTNRGQFSSGRPLSAGLCYQWNNGNCTYGVDCKRWHTCSYCANGGKLGEKHQASTHFGSAARGRQGEQRP